MRSTSQSIGKVYSAICKPRKIRLDRTELSKSSDPEHSKGNNSCERIAEGRKNNAYLESMGFAGREGYWMSARSSSIQQ